jgi:hypothetical protein
MDATDDASTTTNNNNGGVSDDATPTTTIYCGGKTFSYKPKNNAFAALYDDGMDNSDIESLLKEVAKDTGAQSLDWFFSMGRCGLKVSWAETRAGLVPKVIQAFLDRGHALYMNDGTSVTFPGHSFYSPALQEVRRLTGLTELVAVGGRKMTRTYYSLDPKDWKVPVCKQVVRRINELPNDNVRVRLTPDLFIRERDFSNRRRWHGVCEDITWTDDDAADFKTLQRSIRDTFDCDLQKPTPQESPKPTEPTEPAEPPRKRPRPSPPTTSDMDRDVIVLSDRDDDDDGDGDDRTQSKPPVPVNDECCVCYERPANTIVLPCEHVVCCKQCSDQLQYTPNARLCIKCRQPIKHILD